MRYNHKYSVPQSRTCNWQEVYLERRSQIRLKSPSPILQNSALDADSAYSIQPLLKTGKIVLYCLLVLELSLHDPLILLLSHTYRTPSLLYFIAAALAATAVAAAILVYILKINFRSFNRRLVSSFTNPEYRKSEENYFTVTSKLSTTVDDAIGPRITFVGNCLTVIGPWSLFVLDLCGHRVRETAKAAVPRADVEAGADLGQHVFKGIGNGLKVALLQSNLGTILVSQIVDLFLKHKGFLQKVDEDVKALGDPDEVGTEFWAVLIIDVQLLQEFLRSGVLLHQLMNDSGHDGHFAVSVGGVPNGMPHVSHLLLVLHRAAV